MSNRTRFIALSIACVVAGLIYAGMNYLPSAEQKAAEALYGSDPNKIFGKVTEIIDVTGYTYAEIDTGDNKVWAAGPTTPLKKGDIVAITKEMVMENYQSKTLGRSFPMIYFVGQYITDAKADAGKSSAPAPAPAAAPAAVPASPHANINQPATTPVKGVNKLDGGHTIADIIAGKSGLKGKTVRLRGKVTKFSSNIMGKNWVHVQDSSTADDLTVTTKNNVTVGDVVIVEGKLELDKDYGYGYLYPIIVENAVITK